MPTAVSGPASITMHARTGLDAQHFIDRAAAFQKSLPPNAQITVTVEQTAGPEYGAKMTTLQAAGSLGDTLWANQVGPYFPLAAASTTRALDDLAKRDKYDLGQHVQAAIQQLRWKGRLHGMPWLTHSGWSGLFVNEDVWARASQPVPTWDWTYQTDFVNAGRKLTRATGDPSDVYGIEVPFVLQMAVTFLRSWGTDMLSEDGKKSLLNTPKAIAALTFAHDLMNVQKVAPRPDTTVAMAFPTGKSTSWVNGYFAIGNLQQQIGSSFKWRAYPMPKGPEGRGAFLGDDGVCVTASSKAPDAGWKWVQFLVTKETGLILAKERGSPGGRNDVWEDAELMANPNHQVFREWLKFVKPMAIPANARMVELTDTVNAGLKDLYTQKKAAPQAIADLHDAVQRLLDS